MYVVHFTMAVCCLKHWQTPNLFNHNSHRLFLTSVLSALQWESCSCPWPQDAHLSSVNKISEWQKQQFIHNCCCWFYFWLKWDSRTTRLPSLQGPGGFKLKGFACLALDSSWAVKWVFTIQIFTEENHCLSVGVSQPFLIFRWPYSLVVNAYT